jgi:hypothetical protein
LAGPDVTAKMQRQYEDILGSLRRYRRFASDAKRKQVAAATVRKMAHNPSVVTRLLRNLGIGVDDESRAELLAEEFHGRPVRDVIEVVEQERYDESGAVLGWLEELGVLTEDGDSIIPIRFSYGPNNDASVLVVSNPAGTNIEFVGGDQDIDWQRVEGASAEDKYLVSVGPVLTIAYFADKHQLSGPKSQAKGTVYEHEFGEDDGELPYLVFDRRNVKLLLVGGSYTIEPEGIAG